MLLSFSIENWMSFRDRVTFSMVASREKQHQETLSSVDGSMRLLPVAAIYGGNASGKTNLFKALSFARRLVVEGTKPEGKIPVEPFRLDKAFAEKPSRFEFTLLVGDTCYEFGFAVNRDRVVEEWLVQVLKSSEKEIYRRTPERGVFGPAIKDDKRLGFVAKGTRSNQLFLTNAVDQNTKRFEPLYNWFRDSLIMIPADVQFFPYPKTVGDESFLRRLGESLSRLDTGVSALKWEDLPVESLGLPHELQETLRNGLGDSYYPLAGPESTLEAVVRLEKGQLKAGRFVAVHNGKNGDSVQFGLNSESDGTQRLVDLLPAFLDLSLAESDVFYVIDEFDRSLHTLLTRQLLTSYLAARTPESRSQLLFTTHDVLLMDQDLLRRDEMWVTERKDGGATTLFSFSDYKDIRYDKDIRKSYLQGRLGGIPRILLSGAFDGL